MLQKGNIPVEPCGAANVAFLRLQAHFHPGSLAVFDPLAVSCEYLHDTRSKRCCIEMAKRFELGRSSIRHFEPVIPWLPHFESMIHHSRFIHGTFRQPDMVEIGIRRPKQCIEA